MASAIIHRILNVALPPLSLILLFTFMLPSLLISLFTYLKSLVYTENVTNKVVLITGAASGIGEQLAYEYARRGAILSLVDIRKDKLEAVADKARSLGSPDVTIIGADVSKAQDCKRFVNETVNTFGRLDHLVNNVGISDMPSLFEDCLVFLNAILYLYGISHLKKSKGKIIVIASSCGWLPLPRLSVYNASKAAVINFFESLRIEVGSGVGITIVTPGFIKTDLLLTAIEREGSLGKIPMCSASECAKEIVKSACRGDLYVTYPFWVKVLFPWKLLYPQTLDSANRLFFGLFPQTPNPNLSTNTALRHNKMLLSATSNLHLSIS